MDADYQADAVVESGCGGLLSTLSDYSHFTQMLTGNGTFWGEPIFVGKIIGLMATNHLTSLQREKTTGHI